MPNLQHLTTEVEAVNAMLRAVGEAPVSNISVGANTALIQVAVDLLRDTNRKVQERGWDFNSESEVELDLDVDGKAVVPGNALSVDTTEREWDRELVVRGLKLYDKKNHTYVLTRKPKCDIIYYLPWEELPEAARQYITVKAARIFQQAKVGSETLYSFTKADEEEAEARMAEHEAESLDATIFDHWDMASIINRRRPLPS
jgi:hypothetical protein